jgi:hypothetical protein
LRYIIIILLSIEYLSCGSYRIAETAGNDPVGPGQKMPVNALLQGILAA